MPLCLAQRGISLRRAGRRLAGFVFASFLIAAAVCTAAAGKESTPTARVSLGLPPGAPLPTVAATALAWPTPTHGPFRAIAAASEPEAADAAAAVLRQGGNAVDAAAAALLVLAVVEPQSSGLGGGLFLLYHDAAKGETVALDARETAPSAASPDMFGAASFAMVSTSGVAVGIPYALLGIEAALKRWGTMSLQQVLAPAVRLAADGFVVGPRLAESLRAGFSEGGRLNNEPGNPAYDRARQVFAPKGVPLAAGDRLVQADLAATLRAIAERGVRVLYDCDDPTGIARAIIATQRAFRPPEPALAGRMTCADLAHAAAAGPIVRAPVVGRYRGFTLASMPPPSSGGLCLIQMLHMVERFPVGDATAGFGFGTTATLNVMQEAMRLSFADRAMWMGDVDGRNDLPVAELIDPAYLQRRSASCPAGDGADAAYCLMPGARLTNIRAGQPRRDATAPAASPRDTLGGETTHVTVADGAGNVVSATATIESLWGTGLMVAGAGFLLNNELTDFNMRPVADTRPASFNPGANDIAPGRRPRSSMAPTIVFSRAADGKEQATAAFGSPGGPTIINTVFGLTLNLIDHGLDVGTAVAAPRLSVTSAAHGAVTAVESGFDPAVIGRLGAMGYRFSEPAPIGAVQAIVIDPLTGAMYGAADPRRRGAVMGISSPDGAGR